MAVADFDGDPLPEVLALGMSIRYWDDVGDGAWGLPDTVGLAFDGRRSALTVGDADGDGDLDAAVGTFSFNPHQSGLPEFLLMNDGDGGFTVEAELAAAAGYVSSQAITFTDRDLDGDADLFVSDGSYLVDAPSAFFTNDGSGGFVDEAAALGANVVMAGMGFITWDWNGDGAFDYCITDVGPSRCLASTGDGGFYEVGGAVGLEPDEWAFAELDIPTIGWSIDAVDLDSDGRLDAVQASAPDHGSELAPEHRRWPDLVWRGTADGDFVEVTEGSGFGTADAHYGLAPGDFDGDGSQDVVVVGPGLPPLLYMNRCGDGSWLVVELEGPPGNADAIGAVLWVDDASPRELQGPRGWGQRASRYHVGLGEATSASLRVRWPDGVISEASAVPGRRSVLVTYPE